MASCVVCSAVSNPGPMRDLWVHEDELVVLSQLPPPADRPTRAYPGHLLLVPRRHVESQAALNRQEAERIGLWLWWASQALEGANGADHVYWFRLGHGWPHLHLHILARYPGTPPELHGLEVRDWPGIPDCDFGEAVALAKRLRSHVATSSSA
jgi:histidine triad (HIT) family protein